MIDPSGDRAALSLGMEIVALLRRGFHDHPDRLLLAFEAQGATAISATSVVRDVVMGAVVAACRLFGVADV